MAPIYAYNGFMPYWMNIGPRVFGQQEAETRESRPATERWRRGKRAPRNQARGAAAAARMERVAEEVQEEVQTRSQTRARPKRTATRQQGGRLQPDAPATNGQLCRDPLKAWLLVINRCPRTRG